MKEPVEKCDPLEDFRIRSARQRRARTSRLLCACALDVVAEVGVEALGVDDVRRRADLSRGAFYRYFATLEVLLEFIAEAIGAQLNAEMTQQFEGVDDPALRIAYFVRYQAARVATDAPCCAVFTRMIARAGSAGQFARDHARSDFAEAVRAGRFDIESLPVAVDLAHGMLGAILRRTVADGADGRRISQETAFLLRACGVAKADAVELATRPMPALPQTDLRHAVLDLCSID